MTIRLCFVLLALLLAAPAAAIDTFRYPQVIADQTCTDLFDVPAAVTPGLATIGGGGGSVGTEPVTQTTGDPDGFCDTDSRILTGAITADHRFGPFAVGKAWSCVVLIIEVDALSGGNAQYVLDVEFSPTFDGTVFRALDASPAQTGTNFDGFLIGGGASDGGGSVNELDGALTDEFYLTVDLDATTITFSAGLRPGCRI